MKLLSICLFALLFLFQAALGIHSGDPEYRGFGKPEHSNGLHGPGGPPGGQRGPPGGHGGPGGQGGSTPSPPTNEASD